ncbi:hypothetical protein DV735_g250, partial [Chaetothyriales sp. CBS 134920]
MAVPVATVPLAAADFKSDDGTPNFRSLGQLSPAVNRKIEPFGAAFLAHARRKRHGRTFSEDDRIQALARVKKTEDDDAGEISEPEDPLMLQREAKDWKGQDHYAVLGLSKYRYKATDEQIKKAHRKKVLRHHPDKKAAAGEVDSDNFFKCIQRAHEILSDPVRRRQFDSVDEAADVEPPSKKEAQKSFFKKWRPFFESEARFSNRTPVPLLGDENSTKEEVEEFYDFWYEFDSWRTFEYLDEDVPDDNADRDHKRHIEKKNRNARAKRKTEDIKRLRQCVDDFKKNKRVVKASVKDANYFVAGGDTATAQQVDAVLDDVDKVLGAVDADGLAKLVEELKIAGSHSDKVKAVFVATVSDLTAAGKVKEADVKVLKS